MAAGFGDTALLNNQNIVRADDRPQTVGDNDDGLALHQHVEGPVDLRLVVRVKAGTGRLKHRYP
jgi:hypothetical protein